MWVFLRPLAALVALTLTLSSLGCAHRAPTVTVAPPEPKAELGTLGLKPTPGPYTGTFQRPGVIGASGGAKAGALAGAAAPFLPGWVVLKELRGDPRTAIGGLMLLGAGAALAPVGAAVGAAVGAIAAPPAEVVARSAAALERALAEANLEESLPAWIIAAGIERPMVLVAAPDGPVIDTVLELASPRIFLVSDKPADWNPALRLTVRLVGSLTRASDGEPLRTYSWGHEGPSATFVEWAKDDARIFRARSSTSPAVRSPRRWSRTCMSRPWRMPDDPGAGGRPGRARAADRALRRGLGGSETRVPSSPRGT
jgi:hypothetical protein